MFWEVVKFGLDLTYRELYEWDWIKKYLCKHQLHQGAATTKPTEDAHLQQWNTHTHTYTCTCTYIHLRIYRHRNLEKNIVHQNKIIVNESWNQSCVCVCVCVCVCACVCVRVCIQCIHLRHTRPYDPLVHTRTHAYTHTRTRTNMKEIKLIESDIT